MVAIVSAADADKLARPHVARLWLAHLDFPDGMQYLHSGVGNFTYAGNGITYKGVSDPIGGRFVSLSQVDEPQFGQAASVTLVLSGADRDFLQSVRTTARSIEGRSANLYFPVVDQETQTFITALIPLFPFGRMTAPSIQWQGIGLRLVTLTIESIWQAKNFPPGGRWNPADQRRRYAGDKGLDYIGVKISENWQ